MGFRKRKINHATRVYEKANISAFFPYLSRTRAESVIYFTKLIDITNATAFLNEKKKTGHSISLFTLILTAVAKTFEQRPMLNRFVLGRHIYQREIFDVSYVIKRNLTDLGDELLATIEFEKGSTLESFSAKMNAVHETKRKEAENGLDKILQLFGSLPRPLMSFAFGIIRILDFYGRVPAFIRNELPFYCSVFVSNLGSINVDAPFHHLYELGTTSIFIAIGKPVMQPVVNDDGIIEIRRMLTINFTADERICDGYYFARSLDRFNKFMEHPDTL
ncbi:MAG: 2-oxo acid dehydrogenase subunit E2 [Saccharofermentanales bacterium]